MMNKTKMVLGIAFLATTFLIGVAYGTARLFAEESDHVFLPDSKNIWTKAPQLVPGEVSTDSPLLGNGDLLATFGCRGNAVTFYLSKNNFWQLKSQSPQGCSRLAGLLVLKGEGFDGASFSAVQSHVDGETSCRFSGKKGEWRITTWVAATENTLVIELVSSFSSSLSVELSAPENPSADLETGENDGLKWLSRSFVRDVDIPNSAATAIKTLEAEGNPIALTPQKPVRLVLVMAGLFDTKTPLEEAVRHCRQISPDYLTELRDRSNQWWRDYWGRSSVKLSNDVLMKGYYQGLYTLGACCRDRRFPPGLFGWIVSDTPLWENDYHLNYNHLSPYLGLCSANRLEQAEIQDAPLLDFMERGKRYAREVTGTRGILYPVGIGPCGIDTTWNDPRYVDESGNPRKLPRWSGDDVVEKQAMFWQQRSNAAFNVVNMNQFWHCTLDPRYGEKIYPYVREVATFWEDYLKKEEDGRLVIYRDSICEACGWQKNPGLSLGMIRCATGLALELSEALHVDANRRDSWRKILERLTPFPVQIENGKKLFVGGFYTLNSVFPGSVIHLDSDPELLQTARNVVDHGLNWFGPNCTSIAFGCAVRVNYKPKFVWDNLISYCGEHMAPNGFLLDNPHGIENSSTVHNAINEMLCMSVGNFIRPFIGLPEGEDAEFKDLRAWGAFLVSAKKKNGLVSDLVVVSERGSDCVLVNPWPKVSVQLIRNGKNAEVITGDHLKFHTSKGEVIKFDPGQAISLSP